MHNCKGSKYYNPTVTLANTILLGTIQKEDIVAATSYFIKWFQNDYIDHSITRYNRHYVMQNVIAHHNFSVFCAYKQAQNATTSAMEFIIYFNVTFHFRNMTFWPLAKHSSGTAKASLSDLAVRNLVIYNHFIIRAIHNFETRTVFFNETKAKFSLTNAKIASLTKPSEKFIN